MNTGSFVISEKSSNYKFSGVDLMPLPGFETLSVTF